jgi:hypothetical protein
MGYEVNAPEPVGPTSPIKPYPDRPSKGKGGRPRRSGPARTPGDGIDTEEQPGEEHPHPGGIDRYAR